MGPNSAGQFGGHAAAAGRCDADSESVAELVEEGNSFEADAIEGAEEAETADVSEVRTREVPEDDVPGEYLNNDEHVA